MTEAAVTCLGDDTIAKFLDGGDEPSVLAHIARCASCREIVALAAASNSHVAKSRRSPEPLTEFDVGSLLAGKYRVIRQIGQGGMGRVLAARHEELGQLVAIKVLHGSAAADEESTRRFLREGRAGAKLRNDHSVRIYDLGRLESGEPFLVMEYLEGENLDRLRVRLGRLAFSEALSWVAEAAEALAEAHASGLVHRDIKPQNLFVETMTDGRKRLKVLDFGLAKDLLREDVDSSVVTSDNMILGSPSFMSPEQIKNPVAVGQATDVWSLAATFFQLVTGQPPYTSNTVHGVLARILADPPPRPSDLVSGLPAHVDRVVARAMAKDPAARYQHVLDFVADLRDGDIEDAPATLRVDDEVIDPVAPTLVDTSPAMHRVIAPAPARRRTPAVLLLSLVGVSMVVALAAVGFHFAKLRNATAGTAPVVLQITEPSATESSAAVVAPLPTAIISTTPATSAPPKKPGWQKKPGVAGAPPAPSYDPYKWDGR